jgi:major capsid protein gp7
MATIGASYLNLIDAFRAGGDNATAEVAEVLNRLSPVARNAFTVEANSGTVHKHSIRTGLPAVTWGRLYQGIPQSKSGRTNVQDTTGFVEGLSAVDTRLLDISPNAAALRMSEGEAFLESMRQEAETGIFYHDSTTTPEKFKGLAARYNVLAGSGAGNQIVDAGGTGSDNTSIWIVTWGENATHLIHPKGTKAGIQRENKGEQRVLDASNNAYYVKEELFRWHLGLAVRDWRFNARVANIDVSDMIAGSVDLYAKLRKAFYKLQGVYATAMRNGDGSINGNASVEGRTVIYMNRGTLEALDATGTNASNGALMLKPMELEGRVVQSYRGIPIETTDALLNTETRVV